MKIKRQKQETATNDRNKSWKVIITAAGLAGWMTLVAGLGPAVLVVACRAALQALSLLLEVHMVPPAAQTICIPTTPALAARRVTVLANHGGFIAEVTEKREGYQLSLFFLAKGRERRLSVNQQVYLCVLLTLLNSPQRSWFPAKRIQVYRWHTAHCGCQHTTHSWSDRARTHVHPCPW